MITNPRKALVNVVASLALAGLAVLILWFFAKLAE
jgi:hypothetical protein